LPDTTFVNFNRDFRNLRLVRSQEEIAFFTSPPSSTTARSTASSAGCGRRTRERARGAGRSGPLEAGGYAGIHFMTSTSMREPHELAFVPRQYQADAESRRVMP